MRGLTAVTRSNSFIPVFAASGTAEIGIHPLLDAILNLMPHPPTFPLVTAQGKDGAIALTATDSGPLAAYVWKTTADPFVGKLTYFRVYSGTITSDSRVWNQNKSFDERFGSIAFLRGKDTIPAKFVHSGDLGIVPKLAETSTGNTLCDRTHPLTLPEPEYPGALYQVAINPKTHGRFDQNFSDPHALVRGGSTLSWHMEPSTNQTILQGMGDQHIDVALRRAESKFQVNLIAAEPRIPYREAITKKGPGHVPPQETDRRRGSVWRSPSAG